MTLLTQFIILYGAAVLAALTEPSWLLSGTEHPAAQEIICVFFVPAAVAVLDEAYRAERLVTAARQDEPINIEGYRLITATSGFT